MEDSQPTVLHCALGDARSWTEPVTNWSSIAGSRIEQINHFMAKSWLPNELFGSFIHEFLHHWCFNSPVGIALAFLQLKAERQAASGGDPFDVMETALRFETAVRMMRPLAEGLALFAEHDAYPGHSGVRSHAMLWAAMCFCREDFLTGGRNPGRIDDAIRDMLRAQRLSPNMLLRKTDLLLSPLDCKNGGYLAGYLTVKNINRILVEKNGCSRLLDTDLFLTFIRSLFYEDYELVDILFDQSTEDNHSINAISHRLQRRMATVVRNIKNDDVMSFEEIVRNGADALHDPSFEFLPLYIDPARARRGWTRLMTSLESIGAAFDKATGPDLSHALEYARDNNTLVQRSIMCVGSVIQPIRVLSNGRLDVGCITGLAPGVDFPHVSFPAYPGIEPFEAEGSVELFISGSIFWRAISVTVAGRQVGAMLLPSDAAEETRAAFRAFQTSKIDAEMLRAVKRASVSEAVETSGADIFLEHNREEVARVVDQHYRRSALIYVPDAALDTAQNAMSRSGFLEVLGGDRKLVQSLALLSLAAGISPRAEFLKDVLGQNGADLKDLYCKLKQLGDAAHIPLVHGRLSGSGAGLLSRV